MQLCSWCFRLRRRGLLGAAPPLVLPVLFALTLLLVPAGPAPAPAAAMPLAPPALLPLLDPLLVHGPGRPPGLAPQPSKVDEFGPGNGIWLMAGTSHYSTAVLPFVPSPWQMVGVGEFNLDGRPDIVWRNPETGQNAVWLMRGTTVSSSVWLPPVTDTLWMIAAVADFNGDSYADLLWRHAISGANAVWFMHGATIASYAWLPSAPADWPPYWSIVGAGDFNADGCPDIVWSSLDGYALWYMCGSTVLGYAYLPSAPGWEIVGVGDMNKDGWGDLIWAEDCPSLHRYGVGLMHGTAQVGATLIGQAPCGSWDIQGVADFNNDGWNDIVWRE